MGKITGYAALTSPQADDVLVIVDVHDTTMAATGTDKKIAVSDLQKPVKAVVPAVVPLTDAATVLVDASKGNVFTLTLTASGHAIGAPSNPSDGQQVMFRITQPSAGGPYTVTWNAVYDWGTGNSAPSLSTAASVVDMLAFHYVAAIGKWCYLGAAVPQGF